MRRINKSRDIVFNIQNCTCRVSRTLDLVYVNSNLPKASAPCLPEMTSFTFLDIFKRFSNIELRTARGSTWLFSRSWIIASFFTTFPRTRIVNRPRKNSRVFFIVSRGHQPICRGLMADSNKKCICFGCTYATFLKLSQCIL